MNLPLALSTLSSPSPRFCDVFHYFSTPHPLLEPCPIRLKVQLHVVPNSTTAVLSFTVQDPVLFTQSTTVHQSNRRRQIRLERQTFHFDKHLGSIAHQKFLRMYTLSVEDFVKFCGIDGLSSRLLCFSTDSLRSISFRQATLYIGKRRYTYDSAGICFW